MSGKKRIWVAITARPSYSRIRSALESLQRREDVELSILCSGSALLDRYGRVIDLIRADGFRVVDELYTFVEGDDLVNMALTMAATTNHTAAALHRGKPDVVVTIADRYETMGTAVAAAYLGIPLIHVQGGEITGNIDEKVRHAITKMADMHFVSTALAGNRVARMGEAPCSIHVTGCPSVDLARESADVSVVDLQAVLDSLGTGAHVDIEQDFLVVMQHPETDAHGESFSQMATVLDAVNQLAIPAVLFWPNVDAGSDGTSKAIRMFRERGGDDKIRFIKNLEGRQFLALLRQSQCLIGNSSVGIRESAYLGVPVVNIGDRQLGRERCNNVIDVACKTDAIFGAVRAQVNHGRYASSTLYGDGFAGDRIAALVAGETPDTRKRFHDV
ncbi:UDP-N-acetylglucosamine 2-epimerase (hydrolyzing) [Microvirga sp. SRT01]|uniref:UDP-N-acetylglucosamine 2-epimerase (Hydrolyzing) n=1 Tax=Sphingomonas longa TaxID=2778730 RepID=A0ABS2DBZ5_9SPHN|nr:MULTISPECIES: UDP-N-acetylglucosamine 2-epimerase [Alphaproteobacteria]MBM6578464.1 UDP-N-acetylglucosamine 2-epimerase (hydrolyzing) [Sphingomonas sp. BT552]MBR7711504.1 UDP-N-acetylglucosamine 2-epimerase (hydrolyzing) [Microvirga sp. SRT01]